MEDLVVGEFDGDNHCTAVCGNLNLHNNGVQPVFFGKQRKMVILKEQQVVFSLI